jgi:uncharacterized protein (DUF1015 family)
MATLRPFKGLRPLPGYARRVASRPYDVLSSEEARKEAAGDPLSFLRVTKPEIDLPPETDPYDRRVYLKGKENLRKLMDDDILRQDAHPSFYVYAQTLGDHSQYGTVGCVSAKEYAAGIIRKHELTRQDKEDDRTEHVRITNAHTGPIFLMHPPHEKISAIVNAVTAALPFNDFVADDGVRHRFWAIADDRYIAAIRGAFSEMKYLYIADGHHRCAAGARVAREREAANSNHTGSEEYNALLAVLFPYDQLRIMAYNRLVKDLNGRTAAQFLSDLGLHFRITNTPPRAAPERKGEIAMYLEGRWYMLTAPSQLLDVSDPVSRLDVSILQDHILRPMLGIDDPRKNERIDFVGGVRGIETLERRVNSGEMAVAFSLHPTSIDELLAVADAGLIMPPKSTWFEPKLRDGVVVHLLE